MESLASQIRITNGRGAGGESFADHGARNRRMLVLSQDSVIRDLAEVILKSGGFVVDQAETLLDVRSLAATRPVFGCVVDCRRIVARGTKLLRQVAELGSLHAVALVDKGDAERSHDARSAGASALLECPFESQELVGIVAGLPPSRSAAGRPDSAPGAAR